VLNLKVFKKLILIVFALVVFGLSSCNDETDDGSGIYSSITEKCKLEKSYLGKDFFDQGIEKATLVNLSDGDTASFKLSDGEYVVVRFYGVDTPESTGAVEKWGKAASKFTADKLNAAAEVLLESPTVPAEVDSYGSRYLSYVWYKETAESEWKNINIELVENGYSKNHCSTKYSYYSYFKEAETFAKKKPLHIWDDSAEDPYYSTDAVEVSISEIVDNVEKYYNDEAQSGAKVRIQGYLKSVQISSTGTYLFQACEIVNGVERVINVYTGYSSATVNSFIKIGHKYSITGTVQKYNGNIQISGITYVPMQSGGDYLTVLAREYYLTFDSSIQYMSFYGKSLYSNAKVESAEIDGENIKISATAKRITKDGPEAESTTFNFVVKNTENLTDVSSLVGKVMIVGAIQEEKGVLTVYNYSNIVFK
jgi:endonuclease YncB( thermonuclease family)